MPVEGEETRREASLRKEIERMPVKGEKTRRETSLR
jgi:hypothetical protein